MITAREALTLPTATLSPSDAEAARAFLARLEPFVRANMKRTGCVMPIDPREMNPIIAAEVERVCRKAGWIAEFQQVLQQSRLAPNAQPIVNGFQITLRPSDAAYEDAGTLAP